MPDILIAVLGLTGAGKTTFISKATGRNDLGIGHGLGSCTQDISSSRLEIDGKRVVLIDTPGFDDTTRSDGDILELIATHLAATYAQDQLLSGIILLQPISGNRVQGSERKRNRLFEKVCGPSAFSKVIIATTMWSDLRDESIGIERVEERRREADFWGRMVEDGATTVRHDNSYESARRIIRMVLANNSGPIVLQIQRELAQNDGRLAATSAGRQLGLDLREEVKALKAEIEKLKRSPDQGLRLEIQELREEMAEKNYEQERLSERRINLDTIQQYATAAGGMASLGAALIPLCTIL
ncbi:p-loop containing nucleoside triphosphate hydrolase protein [Penicillium angulare]|uniref:P-loop containing nucleoside triphosphate hydrolase protein n=1 Tax=Penicillium angulare TaxID=116970 RepID=A0A9W9EG88_9EURO|nr:p-loop containing nucleoside triphosphate hydrolase protein [Penicillium angulare]